MTLPNLSVSNRVAAMKPSVTVAFGNRAKAMKRDGIDVLSFSLGEPDFDTPQPIKQAAIDALLAGQTSYMPTLGDMASREAIAEKLTQQNGIAGITPDRVAISAGAKHSLYVAAQCLIDPPQPGQAAREAIIPVPAWVSYAPIAAIAGAKIVEVPTTAQSGFKMSPEQLKAAITPQSRLLFLNSPSNPCGTMYHPDELKALAEVIDEASRTIAPNLVVFSDEIYERITYGGIEPFSIGSVPAIAERVLTINGMSKAYAMTGWRIGYAAMPGDFGAALIKAMGTLQGQMTTNITSFIYAAIPVALRDCDAQVDAMVEAFAKRAEIIYARMQAIPGVVCPKPTGAFYLFPDISCFFGKVSKGGKTINSALDFAEALLDEAHMAVVPGEDFGGAGINCIRLSFACSEEQINAGMDRFETFIDSLR